MIVVNYHDDLNEVQGDRALAALLSSEHAGAPFDRIEWFANLRDNCGLKPVIAVASAGEARAVLPLMDVGRNLAGLANWYTFRLAPLLSDGANRNALFGALAADLARRTARIILDKVPDDDAVLLHASFVQAGWSVWRAPCDINHSLEVGGRRFAEYLASRPGPLRTTLKRKRGKIAVTLYDRFDPALWAEYEAVYAASWKPEEGSPAFLRRFAEQEGAAGRLRMAIGHADGVPIAAQLWTVEAGTAFVHKQAYREDARALSPGTVLTAAQMEQVIDRDAVAFVDFGTGDDPYKRDWMDQQRPRQRLDMLRPAHPANWPIIARHALRRAVRRG